MRQNRFKCWNPKCRKAFRSAGARKQHHHDIHVALVHKCKIMVAAYTRMVKAAKALTESLPHMARFAKIATESLPRNRFVGRLTSKSNFPTR